MNFENFEFGNLMLLVILLAGIVFGMFAAKAKSKKEKLTYAGFATFMLIFAFIPDKYIMLFITAGITIATILLAIAATMSKRADYASIAMFFGVVTVGLIIPLEQPFSGILIGAAMFAGTVMVLTVALSAFENQKIPETISNNCYSQQHQGLKKPAGRMS